MMEVHDNETAQVKPEPGHNMRGESITVSDDSGDEDVHLTASTPSSDAMLVPSNSCQKDNGGENDDTPIDTESEKGIFGWETVDNTSIPCIFRRGRKFVSVRIVERKLLSKYPNTFPDELGQKDPLVSHFITEPEAKLLNEINTDHCAYEYGQNPFTAKDLIVDLEEFEEFFKIVKKTFPADVLAKMAGDVTQSTNELPPVIKADLSQLYGWLQINNTVSPYILRFEGRNQVQLVPLSVIVHAAGLSVNTNVPGILPTPQECALLNEACKFAGFNFVFAKNTKLVAMSDVLAQNQVQILELPLKNPLQHARYIDTWPGQQPPSDSSLPTQSSIMPSQPSTGPKPPLSHPSSEFHSNSNPYTMSRYPMHPAFPTPPHLMAPPSMPTAQPATLNMDSLRPLGPSQQLVSEVKSINSNTQSPEQNQQQALWGMIQQRLPPPQAHHGNANPPSSLSITPPVTPDLLPMMTLYQNYGGQIQNNTFAAKGIPGMQRSLTHQMIHGQLGVTSQDNSVVRFPPPPTGLPPPPQYSTPSSLGFGVNQFNSSLFARSNSTDFSVSGSSQNSSMQRRRSRESPKTNTSSGSNKMQQEKTSSQIINLQPNCKGDVTKNIFACLVNGKSISCLHVDNPMRKGRYCLVEAVSKLYFPAVPLAEFVKVLQAILGVNLVECTSQEEAAFVDYYHLPVNKLKCNYIISVNDLDSYFPQLSYIFAKEHATHCSTLPPPPRGANQPSTTATGNQLVGEKHIMRNHPYKQAMHPR